MQEKQVLPTTEKCELFSIYLSVLFKYPVVIKLQQHMAHSRILQPLRGAFFLSALSVLRNVTRDFSIPGWQKGKKEQKEITH